MMLPYFPIDLEKSFDDLFEYQKKFIHGIDVLLNLKDTESNKTPKELFYKEDKMKVFHYKPLAKKVSKVPTLIIYALVNRQYMMDIQQDRSVIKNLLELGLDLYIIDWGYPTAQDKYVTLEDYIDVYIENTVNEILKRTDSTKVNIIGVCQGGTFSAIYTALNPEKVKNLVTMVTPIDFEAGRKAKDGYLFKWSKDMNVDNLVDTYGVIPGEFLNGGFDFLKPFQLMLNKYVSIVDNLENPDTAANFIRMEKWILDSPDQSGEAFRRFIKELYQENRLIKGTFDIGGRVVDLKKITMPVLTICGDEDHIVPPESTRPLLDYVGSKDKELVSYPIGHIGMYVSSKSHHVIAPKIAEWLLKREK
ncbi:class III poly(R)-hydroxyalkanoic acid synthase subunit PhaC [Desulfosporosinus sp. HMP52]|uniref:class III poly(R)-hydroxyalkanoic acid synthase subunit PhaC n=1 Tax=Desulfosporosinus sp. HMP52 TaxID=1487923 RepID=UPI001FA746FD|nr:class III poly(R)-hydroxyalkanoic acid synthase subunit PhaC [Desulfosporosinus sp. HMP52]